MMRITSTDRESLPLSVHLSLWLIGVAILPLLLVLLISEVPSRTSLINQASTLMVTDAKAHAGLIDNYLANKKAIVGSLSNDPNVRAYLLNPRGFSPAELTLFVQDGLALEHFLYPDVSLLEFFNPGGKLLLHYSIYGNQPQPHGTALVPAAYLQSVLRGQQFFSGVYYDLRTHVSSSELYTPVFASTGSRQVIGFVRDTLKLDSIWKIVKGEQGANGSGSYAMLLDQNGVRIIDPDPRTLFTAIAPLNSQSQRQVQSQGLYGVHAQQVPVIADNTLQSIQRQSQVPTTFQEVPARQQESFQIARQQLTTVPWTYFVLTPVNVVEAVANQQLFILSLIGLLVLIPAALVGWIVGDRISTPILRSTDALVKSSSILNKLAEDARHAASQQVWIVDSSQTILKSVKYYTKASKEAIARLSDLTKQLPMITYKNRQILQENIDSMIDVSVYLKQSITYQDESNKQAATAIRVNDEVASQLASGARSTKAVADELDLTVERLRRSVGDA